jgi:voltage-gated potassium channel
MKFLSKFNFFLSVYVIIELWISSIIQFDQQITTILIFIDNIICLFFLGEFFYGFYISKNKIQYFKNHWIDLISSIPMIGELRIGRIFRILRVLRGLGSMKRIFSFLFDATPTKILNLSLISAFLLCLFTALSMYILESEINPYFSTFEECFWWSIFTLSTVGYADILPITFEGKFFAALLIGFGIILIGVFTGMVVDYFINDEEITSKVNQVEKKVDDLNKKLDEIIERLNN